MTAQNRNSLTIAFAAGSVFALSLGLRPAQPLFIRALTSHTGISCDNISLAFGVAQLMWGVAQPVAGVVADRWGPRPAMIAGVALLPAANAATPFSSNPIVRMWLADITLFLLAALVHLPIRETLAAPVACPARLSQTT